MSNPSTLKSPATVNLFVVALYVNPASPATFDVLVQYVNSVAAPSPDSVEELSTFCQPSVPAPVATYIAQSPISQSSIPSKSVSPATVTIQNWPLLGDNPDKSGESVSAFQFPSNAKPEGIVPIAVFIAVCICAPVAKLGEEALTVAVIASITGAVPPDELILFAVPPTLWTPVLTFPIAVVTKAVDADLVELSLVAIVPTTGTW